MRVLSRLPHTCLTQAGDNQKVSVTNPATSALRDARLPEFAALLGAGVPEPVEATMGAGGVTVAGAEAVQVTYSPGRSVTVRYKADLIDDGIKGEHQLVAIGGNVPAGVAVVENGLRRIGVWRVPHDPFLPGLAAAMDPLEARLGGMALDRETWAIGFGLNARGATGIILAGVGRAAGVIDDRIFVAIVVMALTTSLLAGPMMNWLLSKRIAEVQDTLEFELESGAA